MKPGLQLLVRKVLLMLLRLLPVPWPSDAGRDGVGLDCGRGIEGSSVLPSMKVRRGGRRRRDDSALKACKYRVKPVKGCVGTVIVVSV